MEGKVAVIGDANFVMPFSALGVDTFAVGGAVEDIQATAKDVLKGEYALVVVAENIAKTLEDVFADVQAKPTPCITVVPFTTESEGFATEALREVLRMATGIDILKGS